jgi:aspartate kinase
MTKVTDALLGAFDTARSGDSEGAFRSLEPHFARHAEIVESLVSAENKQSFSNELRFARDELSDLLTRVARRSLPLQMLKDAIVSYGEQLSSRLVTDVLRSYGVNARHLDSRRLIVTDDEYGAAQPIWAETRELVRLELQPIVDSGEVPVLGGFIAASQAGETIENRRSNAATSPTDVPPNFMTIGPKRSLTRKREVQPFEPPLSSYSRYKLI